MFLKEKMKSYHNSTEVIYYKNKYRLIAVNHGKCIIKLHMMQHVYPPLTDAALVNSKFVQIHNWHVTYSN